MCKLMRIEELNAIVHAPSAAFDSLRFYIMQALKHILPGGFITGITSHDRAKMGAAVEYIGLRQSKACGDGAFASYLLLD